MRTWKILFFLQEYSPVDKQPGLSLLPISPENILLRYYCQDKVAFNGRQPSTGGVRRPSLLCTTCLQVRHGVLLFPRHVIKLSQITKRIMICDECPDTAYFCACLHFVLPNQVKDNATRISQNDFICAPDRRQICTS